MQQRQHDPALFRRQRVKPLSKRLPTDLPLQPLGSFPISLRIWPMLQPMRRHLEPLRNLLDAISARHPLPRRPFVRGLHTEP